MRRIAAEGTTVLLTTQYLDEADRLAERMAVIDRGRVIAEGTGRDLKASVGSNALHLRLVHAGQRPEAQRLITRVLGDSVLPGSEPTEVAARPPHLEPRREIAGPAERAGEADARIRREFTRAARTSPMVWFRGDLDGEPAA